jgi:hypothetical protein
VGSGTGLDAVKKRLISWLCRESNPNSLVIQPVAIPGELSWLPLNYCTEIKSFTKYDVLELQIESVKT